MIAYHLRQSIVPGEITASEANRLGYELAMRFTKGKHAFIVCTHTDKEDEIAITAEDLYSLMNGFSICPAKGVENYTPKDLF